MEPDAQDIMPVSANVESLHQDRRKQLLLRYGFVEPGDDDKLFDYHLHFKTEGLYFYCLAIMFFLNQSQHNAINTNNTISSSS